MIFYCLISNHTMMISINAIVFSNYMIFEVNRYHPRRHGYPADIRPPESGFCIQQPREPAIRMVDIFVTSRMCKNTKLDNQYFKDNSN